MALDVPQVLNIEDPQAFDPVLGPHVTEFFSNLYNVQILSDRVVKTTLLTDVAGETVRTYYNCRWKQNAKVNNA